jgi:membrane peptidoglycan carboxypeptidase
MKYSIGMSNTSKKQAPIQHNNSRTQGGFSTYNIFKKYSANNNANKNRHVKVKKPLSPKAKKIIYILVGIFFFAICVCLLLAGIYLKNLQKSLPSPSDLFTRQTDQSTQILDRNGTVLYTIYGDQNRESVSLDQIPDVTKWAVLSAEDIDFYQHKGIDYKSIVVTALRNLKSGSITGGASTITQQLVRNTILYDVLGDQAYDQTYSRKIKEILITMQVEQTYSKDDILGAYMNDVPLGGVNYGFQAAAQAYFGKNVQDLDLAESAMLAGIIQSPGVYSPLYGTDPDMAKERQTYVLDQMLKHKDLTGVTEDQVNAAKSEVLVYKSTKIDIKAPHFVFYVEQLLEQEYGADRVKNGGLKVTTTLDYSLQQIAEDEVTKGVNAAKSLNVNNGAMVVLDPNNGQVLAMVGSVDYWNTDDPRVDGNVNVTLSQRQMGSSVKPFVYLTAFEEGYGPWMEAPDLQTMSFGTYDPSDWDNQNMGPMTARKAIVYSRNVPAVYTLQLAGINNFLQTAQTVGITTLADKASYGLSLALGSGEETLLEHAGAYSILANGGTKYDVSPILKVEDPKGNVLEDNTAQPTGTRVYAEKDIYLINWMLCDLNNFGDRPDNPYYYISGKKVCGKTGTTDGPKDLTAVLYDQSLVVAVWNGNNDGEVAPNAWGTTVPLRIANSFLKRVIDKYPAGTYNRPAGVLSTTVCTDTGATPADGVTCPTEASVYIDGSAPKTDNRQTIQVCTSNGLIPTNLSSAEKYGLTTTKIVLSTKLDNSQQEDAYEKYFTTLPNSNYLFTMPATGDCALPLGPDNSPQVDIVTPPSSQSAEAGSSIQISGSVTFLGTLTDFKSTFDSTNISNATADSSGNFSFNYTIPSSTPVGNHTITINVKDSNGKTSNATVTITVSAVGSGITLSITNPLTGAKIVASSTVNIVAGVSGGTVDSVTFRVQNGSTIIKTYTDSTSSDGWTYSWDTTGALGGQYTIYVSATKSGTSISGTSVTVTI